MKQMNIPTSMTSRFYELSDEEKKRKNQLDNYCKQYVGDNHKYKRYILEENDKLPASFIVEDDLGYEARITTPYGVKKSILHEMQVSNILACH